VAEYITQFTELVDQLAAYSSSTDLMYFSMRFSDGLRADIKAIVLVLRPPDLDTACTIAMLQEDRTWWLLHVRPVMVIGLLQSRRCNHGCHPRLRLYHVMRRLLQYRLHPLIPSWQ
jgi:hypothetical protein